MQIKSVFCFAGLDNAQRFASISGLVYFALMLAVVLLGPSAGLYIPAIILAPVLALTSLRRLRDCAKPAHFVLLTLLPFLLVLVTLVHIQSMMLLLTLMLVAAMTIGYLALLPAVAKTHYVQGYSGPVDMAEVARPARKDNPRMRVEPTLGGADSALNDAFIAAEVEVDQDSAQVQYEAPPSENDYQQRRREKPSKFTLLQLEQWLRNNKKGAMIGAAAIVGSMLFMSLWSLLPESETSDSKPEAVENQVISAPEAKRISTTMPDGFSLVLEDDVLIMRWLGDTGSPTNLWSLATAKGDKTCSRLRFNNGTEYRPMIVDLLADTGTEARFSPLDTEAIVVDMARRGNVSLCGYNFSLKGSQAALGKEAAFRDYL
ncbi:hypothetical protein TUM4438_13790 [Shewanella sairae]|uniref:DUF805 domain-containing protein n=1 Tax=Shewanella sairae TaxID=190310 RepID=A0ABQ4P8P3_9GAMM|nr:DUF805 domain-containing protein [Shewanella sairae]MCL1131496.1 DUF805 domain-containing protein [Shewanella sairae]GIU43880.1 hypothetical protein TUM4438_13790 [Shewanella sairae]